MVTAAAKAKSRKARQMDRAALERVADVFRVFSEPTRLAIIQSLKGGARNVNELVEELGTSQANISKQLRLLYDARILNREKQGNQVFYSIDEDIVFPLCELVCVKLNREARERAPYDFSI